MKNTNVLIQHKEEGILVLKENYIIHNKYTTEIAYGLRHRY